MMLLAIPAALLLVTPAESRAQGMGFGMGMNFGGGLWGFESFRTVPSPTNFLNEHALQNARNAGRPASNHAYAGNPNAYFHQVREGNFTPRYDVRRRSPGTSRSRAPATLGQTQNKTPDQPPAVASATRAAAPLASFFDASRQLVWPADAPTSGDLKPKRDLSDEASLLVLNEVEEHGRAPIALAADARQRLLDYGRPALQQIRETATPSIADGFHAFLRSLYNSLSASTQSPNPPPTR